MYYYRNLIIAKRVIIYFAAATFVGCNFTVRAAAMVITVGLLTIFHTYECKHVCSLSSYQISRA